MGITAFFYAAEGDVDRVESALRTVWPEEVGPLVANVRPEASAVESIYRNDDGVVLSLWQDGKYTAFAESELCLFEEGALAKLSTEVGTVIAVCIADHGGSYVLDVYREGRLVRSLSNEAEPQGQALPEEKGVDVSSFSDAQIEKIWSAFGLTPYYDGIAPFRVFSAGEIDSGKRTDSSARENDEAPGSTSETAAPETKAKPWWKFW